MNRSETIKDPSSTKFRRIDRAEIRMSPSFLVNMSEDFRRLNRSNRVKKKKKCCGLTEILLGYFTGSLAEVGHSSSDWMVVIAVGPQTESAI